MKLNRNTVLFMLIVNSLLVILGMARFYFFRQVLFGVNAKVLLKGPPVNFVLVSAVVGLLSYIVFIGLYQVIKWFGESSWIRVSVLLLLIWKSITAIAVIIVPLFQVYTGINGTLIFRIFNDINIIGHVYIMLSFLFIKSPVIRRYFIAFSCLMLVVSVINNIGPLLYGRYDFIKPLVTTNSEAVIYVTNLATLFLFARLFGMASKQVPIAS